MISSIVYKKVHVGLFHWPREYLERERNRATFRMKYGFYKLLHFLKYAQQKEKKKKKSQEKRERRKKQSRASFDLVTKTNLSPLVFTQ